MLQRTERSHSPAMYRMNEHIANEFSDNGRVWFRYFGEPFAVPFTTDVQVLTASERAQPSAAVTAKMRSGGGATVLKD